MRNPVLILIVFVLACAKAPGTSKPAAQTASIDPVVQYLIESAATDFHEHPNPYPARFRNVRIGHVDTPSGKQYRLCGQFQPKQDDGKAEWAHFATVQTSKYEQWLGGQSLNFCTDPALKWDDLGDLSVALQRKLDSLK